VSITILPDEQGRFGFNVKGGIDQKLPIIVSRVGANTPADRLVANCSKDLFGVEHFFYFNISLFSDII
jgi:hypothetical protein